MTRDQFFKANIEILWKGNVWGLVEQLERSSMFPLLAPHALVSYSLLCFMNLSPNPWMQLKFYHLYYDIVLLCVFEILINSSLYFHYTCSVIIFILANNSLILSNAHALMVPSLDKGGGLAQRPSGHQNFAICDCIDHILQSMRKRSIS